VAASAVIGKAVIGLFSKKPEMQAPLDSPEKVESSPAELVAVALNGVGAALLPLPAGHGNPCPRLAF
jgi:hypothetical protein